MRDPVLDSLWFFASGAILLVPLSVWLTKRRHVRRLDLTVAYGLLLLLQPAAFLSVQSAGDAARDRIVSALLAFAPTYAGELAVMGHATITPLTAPDDPAYLRMIEAEKRWLDANPRAADIYTFRKLDDGRIVFLVDAETDYDRNGRFEGEREARTAIGEEMNTQSLGAIDEAMRGKPVLDDRVEEDRWGVWIAAYAPIPGPDGKPEALLGIDYRADEYLAAIRGAKRRASAIVAIVDAVILSLAIIIALLRRSVAEREERNAELDAAAHEVQRLNAGLETMVRERTAQLDTANRELEAFAYSVSHDLRTPLRSIEGFAKLALEDSGDALSTASRAHLERIQRAGRHMATLIDDLLRLSRVARSELRLDTVDVTALARRVGEDLRHRHPERQLELRVGDGLTAHADVRLLEVVFRNLLENAWKYTQARKEAVIEVGREDDGTWFVRDNGCGFDMRFVDKLFRPFQRLHGDDEFEGNGIGLATVARVVERHGGKVRARSGAMAGCTVSFTLAPDA